MGLLRRVGTISGLTLCSRVLGLWRDRLLAGAFGASLQLDAFLLAFALPNMLRNLFGEGALSAAFVPRYVQERERDPQSAEDFAGLVITRLAAWLGLLSGLGMLLAAWLARSGTEGWATVAALALPQLPYMIFICVAAIMAGMLNGRRHFAVPAAAPVILNLVLIASVLWRPEIEWLPLAVLVAGILQLGVHCLALMKTGPMPRVQWRSDERLRELRRALLPTLIASAIYQVNTLLDSVIAFAFIPEGDGAVTVLYCANRLMLFPMALIAHGVGTAIYPELASAAGRGWQASTAVLRRSMGLQFALLIPAGLGLVLVANELVTGIYRTGAFGEEAVRRTVLVTMIYAGLLLPVAINKLVVRLFHAHRDQRTPMLLSLLGVAINVVLNIVLVQTPLREAGLALASVIAALVVGAGLLLVLRRRGGGAPWAWRDLLWPALAGLLMAAAVWGCGRMLPADWSVWPRLIALVACGGLVYGVLMGRRILRLRA